MRLVEKNQEIITVLALFALTMAINSISTDDVMKTFPHTGIRLAYGIGLEVLGLVLIQLLPRCSLSATATDITIYSMCYKILVTLAWLAGPKSLYLYLFIFQALVMKTFVVFFFIRLCWIARSPVGWRLAIWPPMGMSGYLLQRDWDNQQRDVSITVAFSMVALAHIIAIVSLDAEFPVTRWAAGLTGIFMVLIGAAPVRRLFAAQTADAVAREELIAELEETVATLKGMRNNQNGGRPPFRIVSEGMGPHAP